MAKREEFADDYEFATFEDIESSSFDVPKKKNVLDYLNKIGDGFLNNLGKIIKVISFIVAIAVLLLFIAIGFILIKLDSFFAFIAAILIVGGIVLAAISMFLIFGLGQVITQNSEILKILKSKR